MIRQILGNADKALCWLGPEKELSSRAFDIIHEMANRWIQACLHVNLSRDVSISRATMQQMDGIREEISGSTFPALTGLGFFETWNALYDVFGSAYFSSVQSIPEIVLAKEAFIVCGRSNIRWSNYVGATRALPILQARHVNVPLLPHVIKALTCTNSIEIAERRRRLGDAVELFLMI